ncbi:MAG: GspH/FimT family pseudopilin [Tepidimonas sp.]|uniref:GspH/FimT family pseudopilin n=1 Tax=Tepidimonas sp. TaxID=2002775 RepID=UPI0040551A58
MSATPVSATPLMRVCFSRDAALHARRCGCGFTLIELMVTIAVLATIVSIGVPALQGFIASTRVRTVTHELYGALQTARLEAIRRNARVTVCKANTAQNNCDNTKNWHDGWIVFLDRTPGSAPFVDDNDTILRIYPPISSDTVIYGNGGLNGPATYVSFTANGGSRQLNNALLMGTLRICNTSPALSNSTRARDLIINAAGRVVSVNAVGIPADCPRP